MEDKDRRFSLLLPIWRRFKYAVLIFCTAWIFRPVGTGRVPCWFCPLVTTGHCAKTAEAIELPFGMMVGWAQGTVYRDPLGKGQISGENWAAQCNVYTGDAACFQIILGFLLVVATVYRSIDPLNYLIGLMRTKRQEKCGSAAHDDHTAEDLSSV